MLNNVNVFFNTEILNSAEGYTPFSHSSSTPLTRNLAWIGDRCFTPIRYLFKGQKISLGAHDSFLITIVSRVASFHKNGYLNVDRKFKHIDYISDLRSSPTSLLRTIAAIILFIPGLIFGILAKGLSYASYNIRQNNARVEQYYTKFGWPIPIEKEVTLTQAEYDKGMSLSR